MRRSLADMPAEMASVLAAMRCDIGGLVRCFQLRDDFLYFQQHGQAYYGLIVTFEGLGDASPLHGEQLARFAEEFRRQAGNRFDDLAARMDQALIYSTNKFVYTSDVSSRIALLSCYVEHGGLRALVCSETLLRRLKNDGVEQLSNGRLRIAERSLRVYLSLENSLR